MQCPCIPRSDGKTFTSPLSSNDVNMYSKCRKMLYRRKFFTIILQWVLSTPFPPHPHLIFITLHLLPAENRLSADYFPFFLIPLLTEFTFYNRNGGYKTIYGVLSFEWGHQIDIRHTFWPVSRVRHPSTERKRETCLFISIEFSLSHRPQRNDSFLEAIIRYIM